MPQISPSRHDLSQKCENCGKQKFRHTIQEAQNCTYGMSAKA